MEVIEVMSTIVNKLAIQYSSIKILLLGTNYNTSAIVVASSTLVKH